MDSQQPQPPQPQSPPEKPQPVAYDTEGRPLYYHPPTPADATDTSLSSQDPTSSENKEQSPSPSQEYPSSLVSSRPESYDGHNFNPRLRTQYANEPDIVHAARSLEPKVSQMSDELRELHEESLKKYPFLNLTEGEFVMLQITRHPIGILVPVISTAVMLLLLSIVVIMLPDFYPIESMNEQIALTVPSIGWAIGALSLLMLAVAGLGSIAVWVYLRNQFFLTNESVIQEIQLSLLSRREQTVSLGSIEDASFRKQGIFQHIFNYGTMRLSTEGQETTYRFAFVENPKEQIAIVNNAVEAFKNGRPVGLEFLSKKKTD